MSIKAECYAELKKIDNELFDLELEIDIASNKFDRICIYYNHHIRACMRQGLTRQEAVKIADEYWLKEMNQAEQALDNLYDKQDTLKIREGDLRGQIAEVNYLDGEEE